MATLPAAGSFVAAPTASAPAPATDSTPASPTEHTDPETKPVAPEAIVAATEATLPESVATLPAAGSSIAAPAAFAPAPATDSTKASPKTHADPETKPVAPEADPADPRKAREKLGRELLEKIGIPELRIPKGFPQVQVAQSSQT